MSPPSLIPMPAPSGAAASPPVPTQADTLHQMRLDVGQIEALIDDAIVQLTDGFDRLHAAAGAQHRALVEIVSGTSPARRSDIDGLDADADGAIDRVITALQFHDIASQLLAQLGTRIDTLDRMTSTGDGRGNAAAGDRHGPGRRTTPVTQSNMAAGAVQLF